MQKKLIALAVAGLVSAPAFAQSNVTVYGLLDIGVHHYSDSMTSGKANKTAVEQGSLNGSRLGFKGTEDLGNGMKAGFVYEVHFGADDNSGLFGNRQGFLSLSGAAGEVRVGRQYSLGFNTWGMVDPFGLGSAGNAQNLAQIDTRIDNMIHYLSPNMNGLKVSAAFTKQAAGQEVDNDNGTQEWAIAPSYTNGPVTLGLAYTVATVKSSTNAAQDGEKSKKRLDVVGAYNFGAATVSAGYGRDRADEAVGSRANYWMVGVSAPVGAAGKLMASYNRWTDKEDGSDAEADQWALGYEHALSKRTKVYAIYGSIDNEDGAVKKVSGDYQKGLQLVAQHRF